MSSHFSLPAPTTAPSTVFSLFPKLNEMSNQFSSSSCFEARNMRCFHHLELSADPPAWHQNPIAPMSCPTITALRNTFEEMAFEPCLSMIWPTIELNVKSGYEGETSTESSPLIKPSNSFWDLRTSADMIHSNCVAEFQNSDHAATNPSFQQGHRVQNHQHSHRLIKKIVLTPEQAFQAMRAFSYVAYTWSNLIHCFCRSTV